MRKHAQNEKSLETVKIIGPNSLQNEFKSILLNGISYKNRKIYALQNTDVNSNWYRKQFTLNFSNLPHFLREEQINTACNLNDYKISDLLHQTEKLSTEFETHNGICYADVEVKDQTQLERLIQWNQKNFLGKFCIDEISLKCQIQKVLQCDFCKEEKLQFMGHQVRQCKLRKNKSKPTEKEISESSPGSEDLLETQHERPTEVDLETIYFFDIDAKKIMNAKKMDTIHIGFAERANKKYLWTL